MPRRAMETRSEVSSGGVVYERRGGSVHVVLAARRTRRGELVWGLPKGGLDEGESEVDAAIREVREETGIEAVAEEDLGQIRYFYVWEGVRVRKAVRFFLMRATGGDVSNHDDEMEDVRWFPLATATRRAAFRGEREVLERTRDRLG
jgi:8-oxo-dGTP pyrophosphatase MutT (NUDIX family)